MTAMMIAEGDENEEEDVRDDEDGDEDGEGGDEEGSGGSGDKKKLIIIIAAAVLLLVGGGAGLYFSGILGGGDATQEEGEHGEGGDDHGGKKSKGKKKDKKKGKKGDHGDDGHGGGVGFLEIPTMIVNLNSPDGTPRYLRLSVQLELEDPSELADVEAVIPRVVDQFQTYLRELRVADLRGSAGIYRLQMELLWRVNQAAYPVKIKDVLFQEILIQ